jgi:penicillin amidase
MAWGMTNSGVDVTDLYLEKITGQGYEYDGKVLPFATRKETIKVAGGAAKTIVVRETEDGMPLLSDRDDELVNVGKKATVDSGAPDRGDGYAIALRWTALDPGNTMDAVFAMDKASDWTEFRKAATLFEVPSQNLVYADGAGAEGNIGYQLPGRIPTRAKGDDGSLPSPGWDSKYRWTGYIKPSALPYEYNPKRGYIVTANQAVVDPDKYPYTLTTDWGYGTRSQRIADLIEPKIKDLDRRHAPDAARQQQRDRQADRAQAAQDRRGRQGRPGRAEAPGGLGLHPGRRLRGRGLLQRHLAQHPQARLRQQAAQGAAGQGPVPERHPGRHHRSRGREPDRTRVRSA